MSRPGLSFGSDVRHPRGSHHPDYARHPQIQRRVSDVGASPACIVCLWEVLLKCKLLGGSGAFSIMQIRLKQPSSLHRPLVQLRIFSPPFGLGLVVLVVVLVVLVLLVRLLLLMLVLVGAVAAGAAAGAAAGRSPDRGWP